MKIVELRQKNKSDLEKLLAEDRDSLRQLRFDLSAGKVKNVKEVQKTKKEIAQILTLIKSL
ncbi:MAG: 50S ribosomal protein L29 [bacterium]